eukprot:Filipodium_phascolosomae@DN6852_c0_g1_i1.p1
MLQTQVIAPTATEVLTREVLTSHRSVDPLQFSPLLRSPQSVGQTLNRIPEHDLSNTQLVGRPQISQAHSFASQAEGAPIVCTIDTPLIQSIHHVDFVQPVHIRDRIVEIPEITIVDKVVPKVEYQEIVHTVPKIETVVKEKIVEVPQIQYVEKLVEVPEYREIVKVVPQYKVEQVIKEVPVTEYKYVEKLVEVPQIQYYETIQEVPEIHEVVRTIPKVRIQEKPVERIVHVPKVEVQYQEVIKEVPQIIYEEVPVSYDVQTRSAETQMHFIEKEVPEPYEVVVPKEVKIAIRQPPQIVQRERYIDRPEIIRKEIPRYVDTIEEEQIFREVPQYYDVPFETGERSVVDVAREVPQYYEVQVPVYVDVPQPISYLQPVTHIIEPRLMQQIIQLDPIVERAPPRIRHETVNDAVFDPNANQRINPLEYSNYYNQVTAQSFTPHQVAHF